MNNNKNGSLQTPQQPAQHPNTKKRGLIQESFAYYHSGPLPAPSILEHYNRISPGAAERIITMAEEQSKHRRNLETRSLTSDIINSKLGLIFGLLIGLAGIAGSVFLGLYGKQILGGALGFGTLTSLVGVFIYGSKSITEERSKIRQEIRELRKNK